MFVSITEEDAGVILAYIASVEDTVSGAWPGIADHMEEAFCIEDPEISLDNALDALETALYG